MNPDQIQQLLASLAKIAEGLSARQQYTITGAADWPILAAIGGVLIAMAAFMWVDLRSTMKDQKTDNVKDHDTIWNAMRDCKEDCCPARIKK